MLFSPQIPLPLEPSRESLFEDFVRGTNAALVDSLRAITDEQGGQVFLSGPQGSGKSHLLNALCIEARAKGLTAFYAGLHRLPDGGHALLEGLEQVDLVCVDDLHSVCGDAAWEEALFHCFNRVREHGGRLVVASDQPLSKLPLQLPDLRSRLQWGLRLKLQALEDADKLRVLESHALSLGIDLPADVGAYLLRRSVRDMGSLLKTIEQLQRAAFVSKRRITLPLVREVLDHSSSA